MGVQSRDINKKRNAEKSRKRKLQEKDLTKPGKTSKYMITFCRCFCRHNPQKHHPMENICICRQYIYIYIYMYICTKVLINPCRPIHRDK